MKLAELLTLRKALNLQLNRLEGAQSYPTFQQRQFTVSRMDSVEALPQEFVYKPVMAMVGERHHVSKVLTVVDMKITEANASTKVKIPSFASLDVAEHTAGEKEVTLAEALLLRKHSAMIAADLDHVTATHLREPKFGHRTPVPGKEDLDIITVSVNNFQAKEMYRITDYWRKAWRALDGVIQATNWGLEIHVPEWVTSSYNPESYLVKAVSTAELVPPLIRD